MASDFLYFIVKTVINLIYCVFGAYFIKGAVNAFKDGYYGLFGAWIMAAVMEAVYIFDNTINH